MNSLIKTSLFIGGCLFLTLGMIGVFLPLLPTTPFLLLSAACYVRSSKRLYKWLTSNRWLGKYIRDYQEGKGIPLRVKILAIAMLWGTILYSALFLISGLHVRIILIFIATGVTAHLLSIKTYKEEKKMEDSLVLESDIKRDTQPS